MSQNVLKYTVPIQIYREKIDFKCPYSVMVPLFSIQVIGSSVADYAGCAVVQHSPFDAVYVSKKERTKVKTKK